MTDVNLNDLKPTSDEENALDLGGHLQDLPIPPAVGVAAIALNMALKYADITTVQDGTLYQQYKLEGKNLRGLHLDYVFDVARQIEHHLMSSPNRLSALVYTTLLDAVADEAERETEVDEEIEPPSAPETEPGQ